MLHKKNCRWPALILGVCLLCTSQAHASAVQNKIDSTGNKIGELENALDEADETINAYQREQEALEQDIAQGQEKISRLSTQLDHTQAAIRNKQTEIADTQKELEQSQKDCKVQYSQMKKRIRFMYENSMGSMLVQIFESGSLSEALRRANYFQSVIAYDREKLQEYKAVVKEIKQAKTRLVTEEENLQALRSEQSNTLTQIDNAVGSLKDRLHDKLSQIQNSRELREQYARELEEQKTYEAELERQKAEEDRRRQEEIRRQEEELARKRQEEQRRQQEQQHISASDSSSTDNGSSASDGGNTDSGSSAGNNSPAVSAGDLELMSAIIYCEAGNQSYEGKLAVGSVIMNRVASSSFPNSISGVIYQSGQFSPVASGRFAQVLASGEGASCQSVARDVLNGQRNTDCLYFRVNNGLIDGYIIGDHVFY